MREEEFRQYLRYTVGYDEGTCRSRVSNCLRIESFEGSLDEAFERDGMRTLLERLRYSTADARVGAPARHRIPIDGDVRNGTATLRNAANLYLDFRNGVKRGRRSVSAGCSGASAPVLAGSRKLSKTSPWPDWPQPDLDDSLRLAQVLARYVRFLSPSIVEMVAEDNERHRFEWCGALESCGVDPSLYLWEGSPCAFPGIRRYAGSREIAQYRKVSGSAARPPDALSLDDNDFPKQIWSFVFRNAQFSKFGPEGYRLAHLVDHKEYKNRMGEDLVAASDDLVRVLPGLYTCPSNTAYVPASLLLPTDFNPWVRNLILRRSAELYGNCCNMFPSGLAVPGGQLRGWETSEFEWPECVGSLDHMDAFLRFRRKRMEKLIREAQAR